MTTHDIKRLSLVQTVLLRPRMYTVGGSLPDLFAFFNGCLIPSRELATRDEGSVRLLVDWMSEECGFDDALINIRRAQKGVSTLSKMLPREPRKGDLFFGNVTSRHPDHLGLNVSAAIPLFMPIKLLDETSASTPEQLIGRWVECEAVEVVVEKRVVLVRPLRWLHTENQRNAIYERVRRYWQSNG